MSEVIDEETGYSYFEDEDPYDDWQDDPSQEDEIQL